MNTEPTPPPPPAPIYIFGCDARPQWSERAPFFVKAHNAVYSSLGGGKQRTEWQPDAISFAGYRFYLLNTGEVKPWKDAEGKHYGVKARDEDAAKLREIRAQIAALQAQFGSLLKEAMKRGERCTRDHCRNTEPQNPIPSTTAP